MNDALFWAQSGADDSAEQEAMLWAEAQLEEDRLAGYWAGRKIVPGYPVTAIRPQHQEEVPFVWWLRTKREPTQSDRELESIAVECFIARYGSWQSGVPRRLSVLQRARRLTVSAGLTEAEWAEAAAIVAARRDSRNTRKRNARSRRAA